MQELETLLASLYKRGRKPKDREIISIKFDQEFTKSEGRTILHCNCKDGSGFYADLRRIVSLESGLWQFCVENKMVNWWIGIGRNKRIKTKEGEKSMQRHGKNKHQYRLLESALIPEEELGEFLVDNIVIEGNSK